MLDVLKNISSLIIIAFGVWVLYRINIPTPQPKPKKQLSAEQELQLIQLVEVYVQRADLLRQQDNIIHDQPVSVIFSDNKHLQLSQDAIAAAVDIDIAKKNQDLCRLYHNSSNKSSHKSCHKN